VIRYVVWNRHSREGDFKFLCSTQSMWTKSKKDALKEAEEGIEDHMESVEPPYTRKQALEEFDPVVYKLVITKV
jgi:hypothetical protein